MGSTPSLFQSPAAGSPAKPCAYGYPPECLLQLLSAIIDVVTIELDTVDEPHVLISAIAVSEDLGFQALSRAIFGDFAPALLGVTAKTDLTDITKSVRLIVL